MFFWRLFDLLCFSDVVGGVFGWGRDFSEYGGLCLRYFKFG